MDLDAQEQTAAPQRVEQGYPIFFAALGGHAYRAYYTLPAVQHAVGWSHPPQPLGTRKLASPTAVARAILAAPRLPLMSYSGDSHRTLLGESIRQGLDPRRYSPCSTSRTTACSPVQTANSLDAPHHVGSPRRGRRQGVPAPEPAIVLTKPSGPIRRTRWWSVSAMNRLTSEPTATSVDD
jgi:hypothetical protein